MNYLKKTLHPFLTRSKLYCPANVLHICSQTSLSLMYLATAPGAANSCCIFLHPASCRCTDGHFTASDLSNINRTDQSW